MSWLFLGDQNMLGSQAGSIVCLIAVTSWQFIPFHTLLYQGAARNIPATLYQAAALDGAGRARQFFSLTLPLPPVPAPDHEPEPALLAMVPEKIKLQGLVLLAEDNAVNAMLAEAVLRRVGLDVETVPDGEKAVERMQQASQPTVDVILMDCQMPNMDGFEATRRIRSLEQEHGLPRTPIVALTANALQGDRDRCLDCGMDDHLSKPFKEEQLVRMLFRYLPQARIEPPDLAAAAAAASQSKPQSASSQS